MAWCHSNEIKDLYTFSLHNMKFKWGSLEESAVVKSWLGFSIWTYVPIGIRIRKKLGVDVSIGWRPTTTSFWGGKCDLMYFWTKVQQNFWSVDFETFDPLMTHAVGHWGTLTCKIETTYVTIFRNSKPRTCVVSILHGRTWGRGGWGEQKLEIHCDNEKGVGWSMDDHRVHVGNARQQTERTITCSLRS